MKFHEIDRRADWNLSIWLQWDKRVRFKLGRNLSVRRQRIEAILIFYIVRLNFATLVGEQLSIVSLTRASFNMTSNNAHSPGCKWRCQALRGRRKWARSANDRSVENLAVLYRHRFLSVPRTMPQVKHFGLRSEPRTDIRNKCCTADSSSVVAR